jgi:mRNA interferase MazF
MGNTRGMAGRVTRGEIRLVRFPRPDKQRPALILTRGSALDFLNTATIAPITSTIRDIPTEVVLGIDDGMKRPCAVNLDHVQTIASTRLGRRVSSLSAARMVEVCNALGFALGCRRT